MKLRDVRKLTIKQHARVRFQLPNGMECIINEHGITQVPRLQGPSDLNLEEELGRADQFVLEPVSPEGSRQKEKPKPQTLSREQLEALTGAGATPGRPQDKEED